MRENLTGEGKVGADYKSRHSDPSAIEPKTIFRASFDRKK